MLEAPSPNAPIMNASSAEATRLWRFVPWKDYEVPADPATETAHGWWRKLLRRLREEDDDANALTERLRNAEAPPPAELDRIAPPPEVSAEAAALGEALNNWIDRDAADEPVRFVVGPPHSRLAPTLEAWASDAGWRVIAPPTPTQIMSGDERWLEAIASDGGEWVLPGLERVYLRHSLGLDLVRRFIDGAYAGRFGRGLIGCNSWGWAFLRHVWRGRLPRALSLQALDADSLDVLLGSISTPATGHRVRFANAYDGSLVLRSADDDADDSADIFLQSLAAHSRGIVGVAHATWRHSLRNRPASEGEAEGKDEAEEADGEEQVLAQADTFWVTPWNRLELPTLPQEARHEHAFVLHALLLHNGVDAEVLAELLPMSEMHQSEILHLLEDAQLVETREDHWYVGALGYPAVRAFLRDGEFLVDDF